ncbi:MAG: GNAT family protein [Niameybacter sp.]
MIRTIEEQDIDWIHRWNTSEFRGAYQESPFESKHTLIQGYQKDGFCSESFQMLCIEVEEQPIGLIYIHFIRNGLIGLGLVICEQARNKQLGTRITSTITAHLFANYDVCRIQADTDINNISAQTVLKKSGFIKEGVLRKYRYHHGKYNDSVMYSLVRE